MTCWSHLIKLSGNAFSSLMTERGGTTRLHSAQPFTCSSTFFSLKRSAIFLLQTQQLMCSLCQKTIMRHSYDTANQSVSAILGNVHILVKLLAEWMTFFKPKMILQPLSLTQTLKLSQMWFWTLLTMKPNKTAYTVLMS